MGTINPEYFNRVRYTLQSTGFNSITIPEPIGWKSDEKEFSRNKKYHGVFTKFSNNLKFIHSAAEFIDFIRSVKGIEAEIRMIRDEKHPSTDKWVRTYDGYLDMSTYKKEEGKVSLKFNASGLEKALKNRESEKVEIERTETIDGEPIDELQTNILHLDGRRVFLKSVFDITNAENTATMSTETIGNTRGQTVGIPLHVLNKSHEEVQNVIPNTRIGDNNHAITANGTTANMFFAVSQRNRTLNIKFDLDFDCKITYDDINFYNFYVVLTIYKNGNNYNVKENNVLLHFNNDSHGHNSTKSYYVSYDETIDILEGESVALQFHHSMDGKNFHSAHFDSNCFNIVCPLTIEENSYFEPSNTKVIMAHELAERLILINTNRNDAFYSEALGRTDIGYESDGVNSGAFTGFAHGHWVRGFDKLPLPEPETSSTPEVVNKYKAFTTSFKDFMQNQSVTWNLGMGIEKIGFKEIVRIEKLEHFYNNNVTIKLPNQVKKVKRSEANKNYYSSIEVGFSKGGEYEEAMGLDEYNAQSTFTTFISSLKQVYKIISKYRFDSYGVEFARRTPKTNNNTEDTRYDTNIFGFDVKRRFSDDYSLRKWQDDFAQQPTGVFSPETAFNLRMSPLNMLFRHGWKISAGLTKYLTKYIRYSSSTANSALTTQLIGQNEYTENGNVINSELERARFVPEWIEFEHVVDFNIMQQVEGTTVIAGKKIYNFYGLVEFTNENNNIEKGYLFSLKPNGSGKWKLLKANR